MTVTSIKITAGPYDGNGVSDTFSYGFGIEDKSEIKVFETDVDDVQTTLTVDTDYTVSGVGNQNGGTITRVAGPLPSDFEWYIRSDYKETQETEFESQGAFFPDIHEKAFDKPTRLAQQLRDSLNRSATLSDSYSGTSTAKLPNPQAGYIPRWLDTVEGFENVFPSDLAGVVTIDADLSKEFTSVAAAIADLTLTLGKSVNTKGLTTVNDGGDSKYVVVAGGTGTDDGGSYHNMDNGFQLELISVELPNVKQYSGTDTESIQTLVNLGGYVSSITSTILSQITKAAGRLRIVGGVITTLDTISSSMSLSGLEDTNIKDFELSRTAGDSNSDGHLLVMSDQSNVTINDSKFTGINGTGTALIAFSSDENVTVNDITFDNVAVSGTIADSTNTNGVLIEAGNRAIMSKIRANGIHDFAVEFKNKTRDSIISDVIVQESNLGIGFGQSTVGTDDVSNCAVTNATLHGCDIGLILGDAHFNVFSNIAINSEGAPLVGGASPTGIRTDGVTTENILTSISISGINMLEPVRWGGSSENNFASIGAFNSAAVQVVLEAGARRNVTEILHGGDIADIFAQVNDASGNPRSGVDGNPVYSHALGQYDGVMSNNWHFKYSDAGLVGPSSFHTFVIESAGLNFLGLLADGASEAGLSISTPNGDSKVSLTADGLSWQIVTPTSGVRFFETAIRPESDGVMGLGTVTNGYNDLFLKDTVTGITRRITLTNGILTVT